MKKRVIAIVVMVALVMSMVACGSTQAQPVQESTPVPKTETAAKSAEETKVETPAVAEEPKVETSTEAEVKEEPVAEATTEPAVEENSDIIEGIDFSAFNKGEADDVDDIIREQAAFDSLKAVVIDDDKHVVKGILSDGDSIVVNVGKDWYYIRYYAPKEVERLEKIGPHPFADYSSLKSSVCVAQWDSIVIPIEKGENVPLGLKVKYEDGTEESLTLNATFK